MDKNYEINKGKIISKYGVPHLPRWFCDDLVSVQADEYGISEVQYFNQKTSGLVRVFSADMWGGMRFFINNDWEMNCYNLSDTIVMPYGFKAVWTCQDSSFSFEQRVINNSILLIIEPIDCKMENCKLSLELYDAFCVIPRKDGDFRFVSDVERIWDKWIYENECFTDYYTEGNGETHIVIKGNTKTEYVKRAKGFVKHILNFDNVDKERVVIAVSFDNSKCDCIRRAEDTINNYENYIHIQNERYENVIDKAPVLKSPYKSLNDFVSLVPLYHESNKVLSVPGAIRAKNEYYWVWGWDGMSSPYAYSYIGDIEFIPKMLKMYMETADEEKGIGHWFARDMRHIETSMISAQGFYINLLYQLYINGGDITPYYEFAKKIFSLIKTVEVDNLGLCSENSLVPDFREVILETGNDISCFNNVSAYCAVSALAEMAESMKDEETFREALEFAKRAGDNFKKLFFDDVRGFFVSSVDSKTLEQRKVYNAMAIKWDNKYCQDLVGDRIDTAVKFFEENFVCKSGLRCFPKGEIGFDEDANQAHCYWPAHTEYFARIINKADRRDLIEKMIGWISRWTDILTIPEGIDCYINSEKPYVDKWNANCGTWQSYSMRAWYEAIVHCVVGIDIDSKGITFYPYSGEELSLTGLHYGNKIINVTMQGCGNRIEYIILNGRKIENTYKISKEDLLENNDITVKRV